MGSVPVYAQQRVLSVLKDRFAYIFDEVDKYPGAPSVGLNVVGLNPFQLKNIEVIPIEVMHGKLPILGYRFQDFAYLTDVKTIDLSEKEKLKGLKVLVISALRNEKHHSHLNLVEALAIIEELQPE
jgi:phosphoribosyl 1,2-cyclic phosphate phosphodiesterase